MKAVFDAGPIIHLSWVNRLDLLDRLFEEALLPPAVRDEILAAPSGRMGLEAIREALDRGRLRVRAVHDTRQVVSTRGGALGAGESEAILLAETVTADLFVTDDAEARETALHRGLAVIGTIGLLKLGRQHGLVAAVSTLMLELRQRGQWISEHLVEEARQEESGP